MYILVDQIKGESNSRRYIKGFKYFQDLKDYLYTHRVELYNALPDPEKNAPDYRSSRSFGELKKAMESKAYNNWLMTIIRTEPYSRKNARIRTQGDNNRWVGLMPIKSLRGAVRVHGVDTAYLPTLEPRDRKIFISARIYRTLNTTQRAVLVEMTGNQGTITTWIPKSYIK